MANNRGNTNGTNNLNHKIDILNNSINDLVDVLVDGKFILEEKSDAAVFRGSTNQRIIDVQKSLKENEVCLIEKYIVKEKKESFKFGHEQYLFV